MIDPYIQTICDMIAIPSCSYAEGGDEKDVQAYVAKRFADAGARVRTFDLTDLEGFLDHPLCCGPHRNYTNRPTVIGEVGPTDGPALLLMAHSDTVSINNDPALWKITQPFTPLIQDGYVYGRGCCDDIWGVACLIHILEKLRDENITLNKRLVFASTIDEENGVSNGVLGLHLAKLGAEAALYLDGNSDTLTIGNLGGSNLYLNLPDGIDRATLEACEVKLIEAVNALAAERKTLFTGMFENNTYAGKSAYARLHENNQLVVHFYTIIGDDGKALGKQIEAIAKQALPQYADSMTFSYRTPWFEPTLMDIDHPFVQHVAAAYRASRGKEPVITTVSKQDSFVTRKFGLPTVSHGPAQGQGPGSHHLPDERLNITDAHNSLSFATRVVTDWLDA